MFARWQRSERALLVACGEMYFQGVSTRNVQEVLEEMCGLERQLDDGEPGGGGAGREAVGVPGASAGPHGAGST